MCCLHSNIKNKLLIWFGKKVKSVDILYLNYEISNKKINKFINFIFGIEGEKDNMFLFISLLLSLFY